MEKEELFKKFQTITWILWIVIFIYIVFTTFIVYLPILIIPFLFMGMGVFNLVIALYFKKAIVQFGTEKKDYKLAALFNFLLLNLIGLIFLFRLKGLNDLYLLLFGIPIVFLTPLVLHKISKKK
jgi:hypothetical protein